MELLKLIDLREVLVQMGCFLVLFFLLRRFFWMKLLGFLDQRTASIASEYKRVAEAKAAAEEARVEYARRLAAIDELAQQKIQEAVVEGRAITEDLRKKAHQEAQAIIVAARENVRYELIKAKETIRDEIIDLSMKTAEHLIQERLDEADDRRIVEDFLKKLDSI